MDDHLFIYLFIYLFICLFIYLICLQLHASNRVWSVIKYMFEFIDIYEVGYKYGVASHHNGTTFT